MIYKNKFFQAKKGKKKEDIMIKQAFIDYKFLYTRFRARKTVLGARPCTWEIRCVNEQTSTLLIIT